jgi:2-oxo-3-hexenedioate decarboxylase
VLAACTSVGPALEILDSRYRDFKYFSLPDVVADNASSSHVVLPERWVEVEGRNLASVELVMSIDGTPRQRATGAAISGDPVVSVVQLCALLAARGRSLAAGSVVLAGAATVAEPLAAGMEVTLTAGWLGSVSVRVEP